MKFQKIKENVRLKPACSLELRESRVFESGSLLDDLQKNIVINHDSTKEAKITIQNPILKTPEKESSLFIN